MPQIFLILLIACLFLIVGFQARALRRLERFAKARIKEEKSSGSLSHVSKLLAKTQKQLDMLLYSLARTENLEKIRQMRPSRAIPPDLLPQYTLSGQIPVREKYRESGYEPEKPLVYTREAIEENINNIRKKKNIFPRYGQTNLWLFEALSKYPIQNKHVAVMGSNKPWFESVCLAYGGRCTTIEYNKIVSEHPSIQTMTPAEYDSKPAQFDAAFSISSFEHDGLGRYGDPLNPTGDLEAMKKMKSILKPGGTLFLSVPVGKDLILWNAHRVYGRLRLPMLLAGWEIIERFGFDDKQLDGSKNPYEPVFVLKNS